MNRKYFTPITIMLLLGLLAGCSGNFKPDLLKDEMARPLEGDNWQNALSTISTPDELVPAQKLFDMGKSKKCCKVIKKWLKKNPDSPNGDYALFLQGTAFFDRALYYQSFLAYQDMLDMYGSSDLFVPALHAQMEIASRFLTGSKRIVWGFIPAGAKTEGITILEKIELRWPGSKLAAAAIMRAGAFYFDSERFLEAQNAYQTILDNYPQSDSYSRAMLYSARSTHAQYVGAHYDTNCLAEALIRYEQYCQSFPREAKEHQIREQMQLIRTQQAGKQFSIADFYWRTGKKNSARQYWAQICEKYPETDWAEQARQLLEKYSING